MRRIVILLVLPLFLMSRASGQITTEALLDTIQHTAFSFFWNEANASNGLIKDRSTSGSPASIASVGFGLSAVCIGVDHGWVSRTMARDRVMTTLRTFWYGSQGEGDGFIGLFGLFYHFLGMNTATRTWTSELSTIDTALLLAGIIDAREYFDGPDSTETALRAMADSIYYRMNWNLMRNYNPGILMGYMPKPGGGFSGYGQWIGYNEASIMYILAMGSPTHPVSYSGWQTWTGGYSWGTVYYQTYVIFPPLFGHQYSHCWIDYRNIQDDFMRAKGITYFENSRRATLAQRAYSRENPGHFSGYSDSLWGITASDTPTGYNARGAPPPQNDDGTITPTAPISSIPFAPDSVLPAIRNMWNNYRGQLWTQYGFRDAFNLGKNWWDQDIIGIDQGPIIIMIENYRTGKVWERFMRNADVQRGLAAAHFLPTSGVREESRPTGFGLEQNYPNPFNPTTTITFRLATASDVRLTVFDILGREVETLVEGFRPAGEYRVPFNGNGLASGAYLYRLRAGAVTQTRTMILTR
jgi:hypothetical protein